jgi:uncharacterized protein
MKSIKYSPYLRIIERQQKNDYALYHSLFGRLCIIDENLLKVLSFFEEGNSLSSLIEFIPEHLKGNIEEFINIMINKSFLINEGEKEYEEVDSVLDYLVINKENGNQIKIVQLIVSNICNFSCKYCFVNSIYSSEYRKKNQMDNNNKIMKTSEAIAFISKIIELKKDTNQLSVQFFGGEPLTNWKTIKGVLDYFKNGEDIKIDIRYSIVTNGSLITAEIAEYFYKYKVSVIVSFDSPSDDNRITKNGKSSLNLIKKSLFLLKKYNCTTIFNVSIVKQNFENINKDVVDFALAYNVKELGILFDIELSFYKDKTTSEIMNKFKEIYYYSKDKGVVLSGYWRSIFDNILSDSAYKHKGFKTCSATGIQLSIEPNGEIFACKGTSAYFGNIKSIKKVFNSATYNKYLNRTFRNSTQCIDCELDNFCSGICPGALENNYNDINKMNTDACILYKNIILFMINDLNDKFVEKYTLN